MSGLITSNIVFDPVLSQKRAYAIEKTELRTFTNNRITLSEIIQKANGVEIESSTATGYIWVETTEQPVAKYESGGLTYCEFRVNYINGIIDVDTSLEGESVNVTYKAYGITLFPSSRIYSKDENDVVTTLDTFVDGIQEFKAVGEYSKFVEYQTYNVVVYNGKSWWARKTTKDNTPPSSGFENEYWFLISSQGEAFSIDATGELTEAVIQDIIDNSGASQGDIYWYVVSIDNRANQNLPSTLAGDMTGRLISYDGTIFHNFPFGGEKGDTGDSVVIQYSLDNTTWSDTAPVNFRYIRFKQGNEAWGESSDIKGIQGDKGDTGDSIYLQYSEDNTSWHDILTVTDIYIRFKIGIGGSWSTGKKFVGDKGDKGDTGIAGINWKNDGYVPAATYVENDALFYNGSSYRALKTISGIIPTNDGVNWKYIAQKGIDGSGSGDMLKSVKCRLTINSIYAGTPLELYKNNLYFL